MQLQFTGVGGALFVSFPRIEEAVMSVGRQKVVYRVSQEECEILRESVP